MSRVSKIVCDRCGRDIVAINNAQVSAMSARIDLYAVGQNRTSPCQRIDLCEDCYEAFIDFFEKSEKD